MNKRAYTAFLNTIVSNVQGVVKNTTPSSDSIVKRIKSETTKKGKTKVINAIARNYETSLAKAISTEYEDSIGRVVDSYISQTLKEAGITNLSPEEFVKFRNKVVKKFANKKFKGFTPKQRIKNISKATSKQLKRSMKIFDKYGRTDTLTSFEHNNTGKVNRHKVSAHRSQSRLLTSEVNRTRQDIGLVVAEEFELEFIKWVTMGDSKVCLICHEYANRITLPRDVDPTGDLRGVYRITNTPEYPHPHCRCRKVPYRVTLPKIKIPKNKEF